MNLIIIFTLLISIPFYLFDIPLFPIIMRPFRFHIPFFSNKSPLGTSSPSPPPTPSPPPPSRPPFRPAGIAQPPKPETKSKVSPSLARVKSNGAAIAASSPSRGAATPNRQAKQTNQQSGSPSKKLEEQKVTMGEKSSREVERKAGENSNPVIDKPPIIARPEGKEAEAAHEQQKKTEVEKLAVQESKTVLHESGHEKSKTNGLQENREAAQQGQQKREVKEKLELQETRRSAIQEVGKEDATRSKTTRPISSASESARRFRDLPETKTKAQNRIEIDTGGTQRKGKGESTGTHGNPRVKNGEGSSSMSRRITEDIRDGISKLTWGKSNGDEKSVSVVTLTGENRGAIMGIGEKDKKDGEVHIRRGYRSNPDESPNTTATETEGGGRPKSEDEEAKVKAYVNGNSQGINNSVIIESSVSENDPGIHLSFIFEESKKEIISPPENVPGMKSTAENLKNEPRVRRRCLRGLLAESSESETKPRRHGCRFTCKDKNKESGLF